MKMILRNNAIKYSMAFSHLVRCSKTSQINNLPRFYLNERDNNSSSCFVNNIKCSNDQHVIKMAETIRVMRQQIEQNMMELLNEEEI